MSNAGYNIHDIAFKSIYGTPEAAADIPRTIFPKDIVKIMDLDAIRIENTIYIDHGREMLCDLILIIPLKGEFDGLRIVLLLKILQNQNFPMRVLSSIFLILSRYRKFCLGKLCKHNFQ
ncbi:MAG: Rpn family recombination-promoting nuclease/putative transposase [Salinispira sp.]